MLKEIKLTNLLSFGTETKITFNEGLNVLIGANGSGKSNLIEVISLLQAMPKDLTKVIRDGGGVEEWLWKGEKKPTAKIETIIEISKKQTLLKHIVEFHAINYLFEISNESISDLIGETITLPLAGDNSGRMFSNTNCFNYNYDGNKATISYDMEFGITQIWENIKNNQSILMQRLDPRVYPEMSHLGHYYGKTCLYRGWITGRDAEPRKLQRADLPNDFLTEDLTNLGLILNSFRQNSDVKKRLLDELRLFYGDIEDFDISVQGGYVQVFFTENGFTVPATRLSDGTLRYLCLLAILLHPNPPPLICIEEPELGLHPDVLPTLCDLLKEAAKKTQIIITTHSADLIDDLTDMPEAVLVFDKEDGSTIVNRLDKNDLSEWLDKYRLGELWSRGDIGGNRW